VNTAAPTDQLAPSESGPLSADFGWLLGQAKHAYATEVTAALEQIGISPRGYFVLATALTGEHTQTELAQRIGLDKTTMVVTIDELEKAGLAERRPSESDRRARVIAVTSAGEKTVARGEAVVAAVQEEVLASLPKDEREGLLRALCRLVGDRLSTPVPCAKPVRRRE